MTTKFPLLLILYKKYADYLTLENVGAEDDKARNRDFWKMDIMNKTWIWVEKKGDYYLWERFVLFCFVFPKWEVRINIKLQMGRRGD